MVVFLVSCVPQQFLSRAVDLQTLVNDTPIGGTLELQPIEYSGDTVSVNKAITINGNGAILQGRINVIGDNVAIRDMTLEGGSMYGLYSKGDNTTYENITILHTQLSGYGTYDDVDGARITGDNVVVKNMYIDNSGLDDIGPAHPDCIQFATWDKRASNITIEGLACENYYPSSNGFQLASESYGWEGVVIKNTVVHAQRCILAYSGETGLIYEHNTCVGESGVIGIYFSHISNSYMHNNIVTGSYNEIVNTLGLSGAKNNILHCAGGPCNYYNFPYSYIDADPLLDDGYRPGPGSPACLSNGEYIGAYPCDDVTPTSTPEPPITATYTAVIPTDTPTKTSTPTHTATPSNTPTFACVKVVWERGLKIRPGDTMYNIAVSFLDEGFLFEPLDVVTNSEGTFAKLAEPDWWIATDLNWNDDVYANSVDCP